MKSQRIYRISGKKGNKPMKIKQIGYLMCICIAAGLLSGCGSDQDDGQVISDLTAVEAVAMIKQHMNDRNFWILDVRTVDEFAGGHIDGARNLDYRSPSFQEWLGELDKTKTYLVYCGSGVRSAAAVEIMRNMNFEEVYNVLGGLTEIAALNDPAISVVTCGCNL